MHARSLRSARPAASPLVLAIALACLAGAVAPAGAQAPPDTSYALRHRFDTLGGACDTRSWTPQNRAPLVFAHVSDRFVVNSPVFGGIAAASQTSAAIGDQALTSRLANPRAVAEGDSGTVLFIDSPSTTERNVYQVYPGGFVRTYATFTNAHDPMDVVRDPALGGAVVSVTDGLYRIPAGGGGAVRIAGGGTVALADTLPFDALIQEPRGLTFDPDGNLLFAERLGHKVRMLRTDGRIVTVAGTGTPGNTLSEGGLATGLLMQNPVDVAVDAATNQIYVLDGGNAKIRRVDRATGLHYLEADMFARFNTPFGILFPAEAELVVTGGQLLFSEGEQVHRVEAGGLVKIAGAGLNEHFAPPADAGRMEQVRFTNGKGLAAAADGGWLYAANRLVYRVSPANVGSAVAGTPNPIVMGARALWFGADMDSHPAEVSDWVHDHGFGNGWSQRLTSPTFAYVVGDGVRLEFDAVVELGNSPGIADLTGNEVVVVEGRRTGDGAWLPLTGHATISSGVPSVITYVAGITAYHFRVNLDADGNEAAAYDAVRVRMQSDYVQSNEDGTQSGAMGGVLVDNLVLRAGAADLLPPVSFEDGTTGAWTLSAQNGFYGTGPDVGTFYFTRDTAVPAATPQLQTGYDVSNASCVWTFGGAGGTLERGASSRIVSPWLPAGVRALPTRIMLSGKLNTSDQGAGVMIWVRAKQAGQDRPVLVAPTFVNYYSASGGGDLLAPYTQNLGATFPLDFDLSPTAFEDAGGFDSLQFVVQVSDIREVVFGVTPPASPTTRLPYLDDIRVFQEAADADHDGVPDGRDACVAASASGQDADADGCVDPTAALRQVRTWAGEDRPIRYRISSAGLPSVPDDSEILAIRGAMLHWATATGAETPILEDPMTPGVNAAALDGVNLVTFQDPDVVFPPGVLAQTMVTTFTKQSAFDDRIVLPGQVVDADMIFNPGVSFSTGTQAGTYDLEGVATHEFGHFLSLSHSPVEDATMFYVIQPGDGAASLEPDDLAAIAGAYPAAGLGDDWGTITGTVTRGANGLPVRGAVVTAMRLGAAGGVADTAVADYTREDGTFALRRLEPGNYAVRVDPLDGSASGLTADRVNERLAAIVQVNFQPEWHSAPENATDDPSQYATLAVTAGAALGGVDIVTNADVTPPTIASVSPADAATSVAIDALVTVGFSEPIDPATLAGSFRLRPQGGASLPGVGQLIGGTRFVFAPSDPLAFGTTYEIEITTALTDDEGVPLAAPSLTAFTTEPQPPLAMTRLQPNPVAIGSILTIEGTGFPPDAVSALAVFPQFDPFVITALPPIQVGVTILDTRTALVRVPPGSLTGGVYLEIDGVQSNALSFTLLPPPAQAAPVPYGDDVALAFEPLDVAISPDGAIAYAVGTGGFVTVDLAAPIRSATAHSADAGTHVALTPDGALALVSRPAASRLDVVDALPSSGTFGQVLHSVPGLDQAGSIAVSPNGRRAHVVNTGARVAEIDLDPASPTAWSVIRQRVNQAPPTFSPVIRHIAMDPRGDGLFVATAAGNLLRWQLTPDSLPPATGTPVSSSAGFGVAPSGLAIFSLHGSLAQGSLTDVFDEPAGSAQSAAFGTTSPLALSGAPSDATVAREGQSAFVTNRAFNELLVVDVQTFSPTLNSVVATVATGAGPSAVATSSLAAVLGVANATGRSLSFYTYNPAGTPTVRYVHAPVALPGHLVSVTLSDSLPVADLQVDVDGQLLPAANFSLVGAAFVTPPLSQRATLLSVQQSSGERSLAVPFTIADPPPPLVALGPITQKVGVPGFFCFGSEGSGRATRALLSPDGSLLAVGAEGLYAECYRLYFFRMKPAGTERLGDLIGVWPNNRQLQDFEWTPDGRQVWGTVGNGMHYRIDADPSSPTFAQSIGGFLSAENFNPGWIAPDPLGRFMAVAGELGEPGGLALFRLDGTEYQTLGAPDMPAIAFSPDGRYLVGSPAPGVLRFVPIGTAVGPPVDTPVLPGAPQVNEITFSPDGTRAVALCANSVLASFNLDPAAGPLFAVTFHAAPVDPGVHLLSDVAPGPNPFSVVAVSSSSPQLFEIDARGGALIGIAPLDTASVAVAVSSDGRRVWTFPNSQGVSSDGFSTSLEFHPTLHVLHGGTLLSLLTPAAQTVPGGAAVTVRLKVTGTNGDPEIGVPLRLSMIGLPAAGAFGFDALTDANGEVAFNWTMPMTPGEWVLTATADGIAGPPVTATITVAGSSADIPPAIVQFGPADGATGINAGSPVSVRFNQSMQPASLEPAITLTANGAPVAGQLALADEGRTAVFQPSQPLPYDAACVLAVAPGALDTDGQPLAAGGSSSFTVQSLPALAITAVSPPAGPPGAPVSVLGTGFSTTASSNIVTFAGTLASVGSAEPLLIGTHVPLAAATGLVTVRIGGTTSNGVAFTVLPLNPTPGGVIGSLTTTEGVREVEVTPDGSRAYCSNPTQNDVTALDLAATSVITRVPAGLRPQGLAIVPSGRRLYVANQGSDDVTVIDIDPASPAYHTVVNTIPVGDEPVGVAVANQPTGVKIVVSNAADGTLSIIDAEPNNATFEQVTATTTVGSGGKGGNVVISQDGGTAFVATPTGVVSIDLNTGNSTLIPTADAVVDLDITPQGSLVLALLEDGTILVIGAVPGTPDFNQVVATATTGSSTKSGNIVISQDGALAYVTDPDGGNVLVFLIGDADGTGASVALPGAPVSLTLVATIPAGTDPTGLATDPNGRFIAVVSPASGEVTIIGLPTSLPAIEVEFDFNPNTLNLKSMGRWVTGYIEPPAPWTLADIDVASLRLEGTVAADLDAGVTEGDHDGDGVPDLAVKFDRTAVALVLPEGDAVPVRLTGTIGTRLLSGEDAIRVKRAPVHSPQAGGWAPPGSALTVAWEVPEGMESLPVAVMWSRDHGRSWQLVAAGIANSGAYDWRTPAETVDSALVAIAIVESGDPAADFEGVLGLSGFFSIAAGPVAVPAAPAELSFSRPSPNPSRGLAALRFGLPREDRATLEVFDVRGRRVRTLLDGVRPAGWHVVEWNGADASGRPAGSGVYFVRLSAGGRRIEHRLTLLR